MDRYPSQQFSPRHTVRSEVIPPPPTQVVLALWALSSVFLGDLTHASIHSLEQAIIRSVTLYTGHISQTQFISSSLLTFFPWSMWGWRVTWLNQTPAVRKGQSWNWPLGLLDALPPPIHIVTRSLFAYHVSASLYPFFLSLLGPG